MFYGEEKKERIKNEKPISINEKSVKIYFKYK